MPSRYGGSEVIFLFLLSQEDTKPSDSLNITLTRKSMSDLLSPELEVTGDSVSGLVSFELSTHDIGASRCRPNVGPAKGAYHSN